MNTKKEISAEISAVTRKGLVSIFTKWEVDTNIPESHFGSWGYRCIVQISFQNFDDRCENLDEY